MIPGQNVEYTNQIVSSMASQEFGHQPKCVDVCVCVHASFDSILMSPIETISSKPETVTATSLPNDIPFVILTLSLRLRGLSIRQKHCLSSRTLNRQILEFAIPLLKMEQGQ